MELCEKFLACHFRKPVPCEHVQEQCSAYILCSPLKIGLMSIKGIVLGARFIDGLCCCFGFLEVRRIFEL